MNINIQPLDKIAEAAKEFLQKVVTPPLEEIGLLVSDRIKLWRFKNQVDILTKAESILKQKGVKTRKVSLKIMTPLLEECAAEEDPTLQIKWSNLIANTVSEGSTLDSTIYSHILGQLTKNDAELFEVLYRVSTTTHKAEKYTVVVKENRTINIGGIRETRQNFDLQLDNLLRLRLVKEINTQSVNTDFVSLTDLGFRFMTAINLM
jgi:hypothetical protein